MSLLACGKRGQCLPFGSTVRTGVRVRGLDKFGKTWHSRLDECGRADNRPKAMTCCLFCSLKTLLIDGGYRPRVRVNVLSEVYRLAGFQVTMYGRFWVITKERRL